MRILKLAAAAGVCAVLSGLAALYGQLQTLPPTDGLYGSSVVRALRDPFILDVWLLAVTLGGVVGFLCALPILWRVRLDRALLFVLIPSVLTAFVAGAAVGLLATFCVLVVGLVMMIACRVRPEWILSDPLTF